MSAHVRRLRARYRGPSGVAAPPQELLAEALEGAVSAALAARGLSADTEVVVRHVTVRVRVRGRAGAADIAAGWARALAAALDRRLDQLAVGTWDEATAVFADRGAAAWAWLQLATAQRATADVAWWERIFGSSPSPASVLSEELRERPERVRAGLVALVGAFPAGTAWLLDAVDADAILLQMVRAEAGAASGLGVVRGWAPRRDSAGPTAKHWPKARAVATRAATLRLLDELAGVAPAGEHGFAAAARTGGAVEHSGEGEPEERAEGEGARLTEAVPEVPVAAPAPVERDERWIHPSPSGDRHALDVELPGAPEFAGADRRQSAGVEAPTGAPTGPVNRDSAGLHTRTAESSRAFDPGNQPAIARIEGEAVNPSWDRLGPPMRDHEHAVGAGGLLFLLRWLARNQASPSADLQFVLARVLLHDLCANLPEGTRRRTLAAETPIVAVFGGFEALSADEWIRPPEPHERERVAPILSALEGALPATLAPAPHGPDWMLRGVPIPPERARLGFLVMRPGRIAVTRTHARLTLPMRFVDLDLRRAGWDLDPGWVPWIGRVVQFVYEDDRHA